MTAALEVTNLSHPDPACRARSCRRSATSTSRSTPARRSAWSASPAAASRCSACRSSACCPTAATSSTARSSSAAASSSGCREPSCGEVRGNEVAMIFQDSQSSLNPTKTIGEQVAEPVRLHRGASKQEALDRALEVLELVGLPQPRERLGDYPHQLSGGLRQRVMIAIALACEPKVLIADEPTTALDVTIQAQILALLDDLKRPARAWRRCSSPTTWASSPAAPTGSTSCTPGGSSRRRRPTELFAAHAPPLHAGAARLDPAARPGRDQGARARSPGCRPT